MPRKINGAAAGPEPPPNIGVAAEVSGCAGRSLAPSPPGPAIRTCTDRSPLLWLVVPFIAGAILHRLGATTPFPPARLALLLATLALASTFPRLPFFDHLWRLTLPPAIALAAMAVFATRDARVPHVPPRALAVRLLVRITRVGVAHPRPHGRFFSATAFGTILDAAADGHPARGTREGKGDLGGSAGVAESRSPLRDARDAITGLVGQETYLSVFLRPGEEAPARGAEVVLSGTIKPVPARGGPDSFNGYLRGLGIPLELAPAWFRATRTPPSAYARARERLADRMNSLLSLGFDKRPDLAALYRAMMLGRKEGLSASQKALFIRSGTMHLFAINGLHIGIVALSVHALLSLLRLPRGGAAAAIVLAVLWLDVDSTGAAPSALRAFIMVAMLEVAHAAWLPINGLAAITAAAGLLLALRPQDLFSASFQMSFSVVLTLLLLGAPLSRALSAFLPRHLAPPLGFAAAATLCSTLSGIAYFSTFSPVSLPANLALMPLATLVIIAGFSSLVAGLAHVPLLPTLFNHAACLLLRAITAVLQHLTAPAAAAFSARFRADFIGPAALVLFLGVCFFGYARDWRRGFAGPFILVAITLLLGVRYGP